MSLEGKVTTDFEIELFTDEKTRMIIPFVKGVLMRDFFDFLGCRLRNSNLIDNNLRNISINSLRPLAYTIKGFLEGIENCGWKINDIVYHHVRALLDHLATERNWSNKYYNDKLINIHHYFKYLTAVGVAHKVDFPVEFHAPYQSPKDFDFFSHILKQDRKVENLSDLKKINHKDNYLEDVISIAMYHELYDKLNSIDPVYAVMAQTMFQTCLRISNICQIPFSRNARNPKWMLWPEFNALELDHLLFEYIAKGNQPRNCFIWPETIESIYTSYIKPHYRQRKAIFQEVYLRRINAKLSEGHVFLPQEILWLNEHGSPVKPYMLQKAFRDTGMGIHPHQLRHSGATHLLYNYCKINGVEPNEQLAVQFHTVLKYQLGHKSIETTMHYIRTLISRQMQIQIPFALPANKLELDEKIPADALTITSMDKFFNATSVIIDKKIKIHESLIC